MLQKNRWDVHGLIRPPFFAMAIYPLLVTSAWAAEPLTWEAVQAHLTGQSKKIDSLCLRMRRTATLHVDPEVLRTWPSPPDLPKHLGTDEILVAFKGVRRP